MLLNIIISIVIITINKINIIISIVNLIIK